MKRVFLSLALLCFFPLFSMDCEGRPISYEQACWRIKRAFLSHAGFHGVHVSYWAIEKAFSPKEWEKMSIKERKDEVQRLEKLGESFVGNQEKD